MSAADDRLPPRSRQHLGSIARDYLAKVKGGDVGSLPAVLGLVALVIVFSVAATGDLHRPS